MASVFMELTNTKESLKSGNRNPTAHQPMLLQLETKRTVCVLLLVSPTESAQTACGSSVCPRLTGEET